METADISSALHKINGDLTKLINDMGRYARKQEKKKYSNSKCRKDLIAYFEDHLDSLSTRELVVNEAECKATKWVGRYLLWAKQNNETSFNAAVKLVRGHIVYEAAFLPGFASNTQSLEGTVLYLDSPTVCRALGYGTEEEERLVNEAISVIGEFGKVAFAYEMQMGKKAYDAFLSKLKCSRVRIMHIKANQPKDEYLNGLESAFYLKKLSLMYRAILLDLLGVPANLYEKRLRHRVETLDNWFAENHRKL